MFREMRRGQQAVSQAENIAVLQRGTSGVLAVSGDAGYPYAVPMSYVYDAGNLYFHCAKAGHKLDAIRRSEKVSFCVIDEDRVHAEAYTTYFRSVIVFGAARILTEEQEARDALSKLAAKYSPEQECAAEIDAQVQNVCIIALKIEHMTGKAARELTRGEG